MLVEATQLPDVKIFTPKRFADTRGHFMETFRQNVFEDAIGKPVKFVQDNQSVSKHKYTLRGLHYQKPPYWQGKLVRCVRGAILDIAVDARPESKSFGHHVKVELSAQNTAQLWVPEGFLHGFITLEDNTEVVYKCTKYYHHESDASVAWNDSDLAIDWGVDAPQVLLSEKDAHATSFAHHFQHLRVAP